MKHVRHWSLVTFTFVFLLLSARACGPDFPSAVFVLPENPDSYKAFVNGKLEVLQPKFHTRHLVVAYRYLAGKPLSGDEQKTATHVDDFFHKVSGADADAIGAAPWLEARKKVEMAGDLPAGSMAPSGGFITDRHVPGQDYDEFTNCLDAAFSTAATTLNARVAQHGAKDPAVLEWVRGQDAVFSNCGDGKPRMYFGPADKAPAPPPAPQPPAAAPANAPLWLKQDRVYQIAAAQFYALDFDAAIAGFRAIAADTASPWSVTARYLIARAYLRKASLNPGFATGGKNSEEAIAAARKDYAASLAHAQKELLAMRSEARMKPMLSDIDDLLDYVGVRVDPDAQSVVLAERFLHKDDPRFRQALIDFTVIHTSLDQGNSIVNLTPAEDSKPATRREKAEAQGAADLVDWVDALNGEDTDTAVTRWKSSHSSVWLAAALMLTKEPTAETPALIRAANAVPVGDPAYLTVTYHRLRLSPPDATTRLEVVALLPQVQKVDGPSAINQFMQLSARNAPTLEDWLKAAPRAPAGEDSDFEIDVDKATIPKEDVCGHTVASYELFDHDAAVTFNQSMPLSLLASAAESHALPANLRFQVAQAAWARAVLLDRPEIAKRMSPLLIGCRATWKPVLDAYDKAATPNDRHANGLLALMRFASTEPDVRDGEERRGGFATFDEFRQNWWCSTVPLPTETVDSEPVSWRPKADPDAPHGDDPATMTKHPHVAPDAPSFVTPADLAEAKIEVTALRAIPDASTYFAQQALAYMQQHPKDPRTPEILGYANRVLRNTCRHDPDYNVKPGAMNTATFAHALFDALHQHYPTSPWTEKYDTWQ